MGLRAKDGAWLHNGRWHYAGERRQARRDEAIAKWKAEKDAERAAARDAWKAAIVEHSDPVLIRGVAGFGQLEQLTVAVPTCPRANVRVRVRWAGRLPVGTIILAGERPGVSDAGYLTYVPQRCRVLRFTPMGLGDDAAEVLGRLLPTPKKRRKPARRTRRNR